MTKHKESPTVDPLLLRIELARCDMPQAQLAIRLGHPPSTLGSWVRGIAPTPPDLVARIEKELGLKAGSIKQRRRKS